MNDELWTLEQLPDRVADLLSDGYEGQSNGRVRELPNGRTIRWYTTIGLVDRPVGTRGRSALYGTRHLLQLAAVKRLQAAGRTLAEIQEQLLGATNERLADLAKVPRMDVAWSPQQVRVDDFWRATAHTNDTPQDDSVADSDSQPGAELIHAIRLGDSVTVTLDAATRPPDADELAAIQAAAAPLLELLDRIGLAHSPRKENR
ncbi:MerR family transcriptional regulator [Actinophytocola sediminis]